MRPTSRVGAMESLLNAADETPVRVSNYVYLRAERDEPNQCAALRLLETESHINAASRLLPYDEGLCLNGQQRDGKHVSRRLALLLLKPILLLDLGF